jgi:hypothetical protein
MIWSQFLVPLDPLVKEEKKKEEEEIYKSRVDRLAGCN